MFGVAALALSLVAAPSIRFFGKPAAALAPQAPAAVPVSAGMVTVRNTPIFIDGLATVQSIDTMSVVLRVNGQIMRVYFHSGAGRDGGALFLIDPRPYQAACDRAQGQLAHDMATLGEANRSRALSQSVCRELDRRPEGG